VDEDEPVAWVVGEVGEWWWGGAGGVGWQPDVEGLERVAGVAVWDLGFVPGGGRWGGRVPGDVGEELCLFGEGHDHSCVGRMAAKEMDNVDRQIEDGGSTAACHRIGILLNRRHIIINEISHDKE